MPNSITLFSLLAGRRPAREPARELVRELDSVIEFGLNSIFKCMEVQNGETLSSTSLYPTKSYASNRINVEKHMEKLITSV